MSRTTRKPLSLLHKLEQRRHFFSTQLQHPHQQRYASSSSSSSPSSSRFGIGGHHCGPANCIQRTNRNSSPRTMHTMANFNHNHNHTHTHTHTHNNSHRGSQLQLQRQRQPQLHAHSRRAFALSIYNVGPVEFSSEMEFRDTSESTPRFGIYRCVDEQGDIVEPSTFSLPFSEDELLDMYRTMHLTMQFDTIFEGVQRIGQISFYMPNSGEEACQVGSGAVWSLDDVLFFQYRELGTFLQRGFPLQQCADVCYSNTNDYNQGKQMPVHYGSKELNCVTISSTLATQMPQAAGAAYALKRSGKNACAVCYFGEGAASEGDAHAAFNFSATTEAPIIWFCRNNGYAISTPARDQYRGDGIATRAYGYGMVVSRFDGNDLFASYKVSKHAREVCVAQQRPVLLEAMTYRAGNHSTSDEASTYRGKAEAAEWSTKYNPIRRVRLFMEKQGLWTEAQEKALTEEVADKVDQVRRISEKTLKPHWKECFDDVFQELTPNLIKQRAELEAHLSVYGQEDFYKMHDYSTKRRGEP